MDVVGRMDKHSFTPIVPLRSVTRLCGQRIWCLKLPAQASSIKLDQAVPSVCLPPPESFPKLPSLSSYADVGLQCPSRETDLFRIDEKKREKGRRSGFLFASYVAWQHPDFRIRYPYVASPQAHGISIQYCAPTCSLFH